MKRLAPAITAAASIGALCVPEAQANEHLPSPYTLRPEIELPLLLGGVTLWIVPSIANRGNIIPPCDPCDAGGVNALDREVIGLRSAAWDTTGDVLVVAIPALASVAGSF